MNQKPIWVPAYSRFLGSLDSTRNGYFLNESQNEHWWLPKTRKDWQERRASAKAMAIRQILFGDMLVLSRNQYVDSSAWFDIALDLMKLDEPFFAISIYPESLKIEPQSYLIEVANTFKNAQFALSAWPTLASGERSQVGDNILQKGHFLNMFDGITIDSGVKDLYEHQQEVLQKVYDHIKKHYPKNRERHILTRAIRSKSSLWEKIKRDINNSDSEKQIKESENVFVLTEDYISIFREIEQEANSLIAEGSKKKKEVSSWLSQRSNLYSGITSRTLPNSALRNLLQLHIDWRYTDCLTESCLGFVQSEYMDSSDSHINHEVRDNHLDLLSRLHNENLASEDIDAYFAKTKKDIIFTDSVIELLNDPKMEDIIREIRGNRNDRKIDQRARINKESEYISIIAESITGFYFNQKRDSRASLMKFGAGAGLNTVIMLISKTTGINALDIPIGYQLGAEFVKDFALERFSDVLVDGVEDKIDLLLQGNKRAMTGKIVSWLDKYEE